MVKEAVLTELPVVSVDVGDVLEVLEGVTPSTVVAWPEPWGTDAARAEIVQTLADRLAEILANRTRSNGRGHRDRIDVHGAARAVAAVYRQILRRTS